MERARKALGNLDTQPVIELDTGVEKRSINREAVRDQNSKILFPPRDSQGRALPFFCEGELRVGGVADGLVGHDEFSYWKTEVNPNAFGIRDILRFADAPPSAWENYTSKPSDFPECRQCEFAKFDPDSKTGAQLRCSKGIVSGRYPACTAMCLRQKIRFQRGENIGLPPEQIKALQESYQEKETVQKQNEEWRAEHVTEQEMEEKPIMRLRRKLPPVRRGKSTETNAKKGAEKDKNIFGSDVYKAPVIPLPRKGEAPEPRHRRTLKK